MDFAEQSASSGPHFEGRVSETVSIICVIILQTFGKSAKQSFSPAKLLPFVKYYSAAATLFRLYLVHLLTSRCWCLAYKGEARICQWGVHGSRWYPVMSTHISGAA